MDETALAFELRRLQAIREAQLRTQMAAQAAHLAAQTPEAAAAARQQLARQQEAAMAQAVQQRQVQQEQNRKQAGASTRPLFSST
jgi:hypothetical protein